MNKTMDFLFFIQAVLLIIFMFFLIFDTEPSKIDVLETKIIEIEKRVQKLESITFQTIEIKITPEQLEPFFRPLIPLNINKNIDDTGDEWCQECERCLPENIGCCVYHGEGVPCPDEWYEGKKCKHGKLRRKGLE